MLGVTTAARLQILVHQPHTTTPWIATLLPRSSDLRPLSNELCVGYSVIPSPFKVDLYTLYSKTCATDFMRAPYLPLANLIHQKC